MNKALAILTLVISSFSAIGQDSLGTINGTLNVFFTAMQERGDDRQSQLKLVLLPDARLNAVSVNGRGESRVTLGNLQRFILNSQGFYDKYEVYLDEVDRSVDYYADLACVNSLIFQTVKDRTSGTEFKQEVWYSIDLVYTANRWHIVQATWTSDLSEENLQQSIITDTLWHRIERP